LIGIHNIEVAVAGEEHMKADLCVQFRIALLIQTVSLDERINRCAGR